MSILKLKPSCKDYLWGGHRLAEEYGVKYDGKVLAEAWVPIRYFTRESLI